MQSTWEGIKSRRVGGAASAGIQHRAAVEEELSEIRFKDGESVDDFLMWVTGLANSITTTTTSGALLMRVNLQAQGLWHAVGAGGRRNDRVSKGLASVRRHIYDLCLQRCWRLSLPSAPRNQPRRESNPIGLVVLRVRESNIEQLWKRSSRRSALRMVNPSVTFLMWITELANSITTLSGSISETEIINFSMWITGLANSITTLSGSISETEIMKKMLQRSPQITLSKSRFQSRHYLT